MGQNSPSPPFDLALSFGVDDTIDTRSSNPELASNVSHPHAGIDEQQDFGTLGVCRRHPARRAGSCYVQNVAEGFGGLERSENEAA
jgi:hypothetical protein